MKGGESEPPGEHSDSPRLRVRASFGGSEAHLRSLDVLCQRLSSSLSKHCTRPVAYREH